MVKALLSPNPSFAFDLYFPDVRILVRFVYGDVNVQKPSDYTLYESFSDELEVSDELYNIVVNIYGTQERLRKDIEKLAMLKPTLQ